MVKFGFSTVAETMTLGREAARRISEAFQRPIRLEFEKVCVSRCANTLIQLFLSRSIFRICSSARSATPDSFGLDLTSNPLCFLVSFLKSATTPQIRQDGYVRDEMLNRLFCLMSFLCRKGIETVRRDNW